MPVLIYINGGGYTYGGNPRNWPFASWINKSPNVTIVSVYYCLDSFGFLTTPEFADARKWIKSYISKFGSDPTKVTINGQSAGGSFVELHMIANEGEQLFLVLLRRVSSGRLFPLLDSRVWNGFCGRVHASKR